MCEDKMPQLMDASERVIERFLLCERLCPLKRFHTCSDCGEGHCFDMVEFGNKFNKLIEEHFKESL